VLLPAPLLRVAERSSIKRSPAPFVKWAGGKSGSLHALQKLFPTEFNTYYEPFLGGGAVFFHLWSLRRIKHAVLSDSSKALINAYAAIRNDLKGLLVRLEALQSRAKNEDFYYKVARPTFNRIELATGLEGNLMKAALMIYLNKTCYNGVFRVNGKGGFNVPRGAHKNPRIYDKEILESVRSALIDNAVELRCANFSEALRTAQKKDLVYLDPPYDSIGPKPNFTDYTSEGFGKPEQRNLALLVKELDQKGCLVMLSNSYSSRIKSLYQETLPKAHFETIRASRAVNRTGEGRGKIREYVITNYLPPSTREANHTRSP
jgi:DNA adenine methylase